LGINNQQAKQKGASVIDKAHLTAMVERTTEQPVIPNDVLRYIQAVEVRDLSVYQEIVQ